MKQNTCAVKMMGMPRSSSSEPKDMVIPDFF
jgi:hypothetical protein